MKRHYYLCYDQETRQVLDSVHATLWLRKTIGRYPDPSDGKVWDWYVNAILAPYTEE